MDSDSYNYPAHYKEFPIVKDTTPNMMNPRLYITNYNKTQGQQFDRGVLALFEIQQVEKIVKG